jgi:hypothetical protein
VNRTRWYLGRPFERLYTERDVQEPRNHSASYHGRVRSDAAHVWSWETSRFSAYVTRTYDGVEGRVFICRTGSRRLAGKVGPRSRKFKAGLVAV